MCGQQKRWRNGVQMGLGFETVRRVEKVNGNKLNGLDKMGDCGLASKE